MANYYRRCLKNAARDQASLTAYLKDHQKGDKRKITWTKDAEEAFIACKSALANAALLAHSTEAVPLILTTDASDTAIGATLKQHIQSEIKPIAFFSKKLSDAQRRYSAYDRELLAIYSAVKYFKYLLEGRQVIVFTDHKHMRSDRKWTKLPLVRLVNLILSDNLPRTFDIFPVPRTSLRTLCQG